jgi:hypothetical protein
MAPRTIQNCEQAIHREVTSKNKEEKDVGVRVARMGQMDRHGMHEWMHCGEIESSSWILCAHGTVC